MIAGELSFPIEEKFPTTIGNKKSKSVTISECEPKGNPERIYNLTAKVFYITQMYIAGYFMLTKLCLTGTYSLFKTPISLHFVIADQFYAHEASRLSSAMLLKLGETERLCFCRRTIALPARNILRMLSEVFSQKKRKQSQKFEIRTMFYLILYRWS